MEVSDFLISSLSYFIGAAPSLVFWIVVFVFTVIILRRSGGRAERFLLAGASLGIAGSLLRVPTGAITFWLFHQGYSDTYIGSVSTGCEIFLNVVSMAGVICFIYAFWIRFKANNHNIAESVNEEQIAEVAT